MIDRLKVVSIEITVIRYFMILIFVSRKVIIFTKIIGVLTGDFSLIPKIITSLLSSGS